MKRRTVWTTVEDKMIMRMVESSGLRWRQMETAFVGRSDDSIRNRYQRLIGRAQQPKHEKVPCFQREYWTREEDRTIMEHVHIQGHNWVNLQAKLQKRTVHAIRNRYSRLLRNLDRGDRSATSEISSDIEDATLAFADGDDDRCLRQPGDVSTIFLDDLARMDRDDCEEVVCSNLNQIVQFFDNSTKEHEFML